jgi:membrane protease YdiL (CAAX protease family)
MSGENSKSQTYALIALGVILVEKLTVSFLFRSLSVQTSRIEVALAVHGGVFAWLIPLLIVYFVENRDHRSLGLIVERSDIVKYCAYGIVGLLIPAIILGIDQNLLVSLLEQLVSIGVAEEVLWRGYLQARLCSWRGKYQGWLVSSLLFGVGHLISLWSQPGITPRIDDLTLVAQTTIGGFILGYIFLRTRSIVPGAIFHVFGNVYLFRLLDLFSS